MKSRIRNAAEDDLRKVEDRTEKRVRKHIKDPTLEGKDETKVGRIPEKTASVE